MNRSVIRRATVPALTLLMASLAPATALAESVRTTAIPVPSAAATSAVPARPGAGPGQSAKTAITKEQALAIITGYFGPVRGLGTLTPVLSQNGDRAVWNLEYTVQQGNSGWGTTLGAVDATTGKVLSFRYQTPDTRLPRTGPLAKPYPEAYARTWAWALVRDLYPEYAAELVPSPEATSPYYYGLAGTNTYTFTWTLTHEGVPVENRFIRVQVEKDTLNYVGLDQNLLSPVTYEGGPATLTPEEAMQRFAAAQPELAYQMINAASPYDVAAGAKPTPTLVYTLNTPPLLAATGEPINSWSAPATKPEKLPPADSAAAQPAPSLPLTQDQAITLVRGLLDAPVSVQVRTSDMPLPTGADAPDILQVTLMGPSGYYGSASINLKTGRIQNVNSSSRQPDPMADPKSPTAEQKARAKATAIALVQRYYPDLSAHVRVSENPFYGSNRSVASFSFFRYEGDIPLQYNQINVVVNLDTLKLESMYLNWQDGLTLPDPSQAISPDAARQILLKGRTPRLTWLEDVSQPPRPMVYGPYGPSQTEPATMRLAYVLPAADGVPVIAVNALTGSRIDVRGQLATDAGKVDKLLSGHRAEGELRYLLDLGALTPDQLNPDAPIARGDALQILQRGRQYPFGSSYGVTDPFPYSDVAKDSPLYSTIQSALADHVLVPQAQSQTFEPDKQITRADFAVWIARSLGLGKLARSGLQTQAPAGITAPEQRNAIAFLEALGILSGGDYTAPLTQADAAAAIVRLVIYDRMQ